MFTTLYLFCPVDEVVLNNSIAGEVFIQVPYSAFCLDDDSKLTCIVFFHPLKTLAGNHKELVR